MAWYSGTSYCPIRLKRQGLWCAVTAMVLSVAGVDSALGQSFCRYEVTALVPGPSCGIFGPANVTVHGLNDLGQVVGAVHECAGGSRNFPFVWSEETGLMLLPFPEDVNTGWAVAINNVVGSDGLGQIACRLTVQLAENDFASRAFLYDDGEWIALGTLPGHTTSHPFAINDNTEIVGESHGGGNGIRGFLWRDGKIMEIDLPVGPNSEAHDVNEASDIVGWMGQGVTTSTLGFLHSEFGTEGIPPVANGNTSEANAVNSSNIVVGESRLPVKSGPVARRAWIHENGVLGELPNPEDFHRTRGIDINDAGQVMIETSDPDPFVNTYGILWQDGEWVDFPSVFDAPPDVFFNGNRVVINNRGQLAGDEGLGFILLSPVDRPLGDVNIDCRVDEHDLTAVLNDWGPCAEVGSCLCDIVTSATFQPPGDGVVDGADLAVVLGNWSAAPTKPASQTRR